MDQERWTDVDRYLEGVFAAEDEALAAALRASQAANLPAIQVSPVQGKLLMLLARLRGARRILEIGTLGGYSTIWLARGLPPGGRVISLELDERHAAVARANCARAGFDGIVEIRVGTALESLAQIDAQALEPFDLIFIDADKVSYPDYFTWAVRLASPNALIVADNVVRGGEVADAASADASVRAVRRLFELMAADPRVNTTVLQTVGVKGYDGLAFAVVTANK